MWLLATLNCTCTVCSQEKYRRRKKKEEKRRRRKVFQNGQDLPLAAALHVVDVVVSSLELHLDRLLTGKI